MQTWIWLRRFERHNDAQLATNAFLSLAEAVGAVVSDVRLTYPVTYRQQGDHGHEYDTTIEVAVIYRHHEEVA